MPTVRGHDASLAWNSHTAARAPVDAHAAARASVDSHTAARAMVDAHAARARHWARPACVATQAAPEIPCR